MTSSTLRTLFILTSKTASRSSISSTALTSDTIDTTDTTNAIVRTSSAKTSPSPFLPLENSNAGSSPPSKDWIAGAVLGPLAALLIIAGLAFWIGRRSRSPPPASASYASSAVAPMPNQGQVMSGYPGVATAVEAPSYVYGVSLPQQQQPQPPELHGQGGHSTDWRGRGELAG
ncbi:MAG: hypothetical protein M1833_006086 [Piccolia ochrophora]|nr:MAG: hypothetical protein M1833_006086 [Piccolia ochrophora]